ncbi:hypothetical protein H4R35_005024 [Dimargaris xerosporica]|nr:hypothetical protein H4R35_005024 [Dimargaris xerosporica]
MGSGRQRKGAASDMDAPDRPMKAISASQIIQQYPRRTRLAHACQALCIVIILFFAMSQFITETWTWGMENRYTNWHYWLPYKKVTLSIDQLKEYDGSDLSRPIYIAIK